MAIKTIVVKGTGIRAEAIANAAITPGDLVEVMTTGKLRVHAGAGLVAAAHFAVEDDMQGRAISTDYDADDLVQYETFNSGDEVLANLANGEVVAIGTKVESNGDGQLRAVDTDSSAATIEVGSIIGEAMEALDMSGSSLVDPSSNRFRVRIIK